jgi:23S rRNA pseudouridine1911/1915/1917 synthase
MVIPGRRTADPAPESLALTRNFLHAAELEFAHPRSGKAMQLRSPLPTELEDLLKQIESGRIED